MRYIEQGSKLRVNLGKSNNLFEIWNFKHT